MRTIRWIMTTMIIIICYELENIGTIQREESRISFAAKKEKYKFWSPACQKYVFTFYIAFVSSSLGRQCEVLTIAVENRTNILYLVRYMKNLRALNVRCRPKFEMNQISLIQFLSTIDGLVNWLKQPLSTTESNFLRLWIR